MKKIKLITVILTSVLITSWSLFSLTVNEEEVRKVQPIEFQDFKGRSKIKNKHSEIVGIGKSLKEGLRGRKKAKYTWMGKYTIVHAIDRKSKKMNADIFIIEKRARVDTIYNVRRILSGYLQAAYGFSYDDAFTLAKFITYYNAVYRSNMEYFGEKYSKKVLSYLSAKTAGIDINYKNWSGKTRILIPLKENGAGLDTTNITDDKVIESLKKEKEDRGVGDRKEIVKLKKDEVKKEKKKIEKKKEAVKKKEKEIKEKEKEIIKKKEKIDKIVDEKEKEKETKKLKKEEKELEKEKKVLRKKKEEIEKGEKKIVDKETEIKKDTTEIKKDEELNELKKDPDKAIKELEETRKELSEKEDELAKEKDSVMEGKIYYLKVKKRRADGHYLNDMVIINPATRAITARSPVEKICGQKYLLKKTGVIVIVRNDNEPADHNLVLLDKEKLALVKKGEVDIYWKSFIEERDGNIYAIIRKDESYFLARFSADLQLLKTSTVEMDKDSFISFFGETIYINRADKTIVVLDKASLSFVAEIKP